jgi:hypothetical protein
MLFVEWRILPMADYRDIVILRHAQDDFYALQIAQGMEDAGAEVFSIVCQYPDNPADRQRNPLAFQENPLRFVVFAKYMCPVTPDLIDAAIEKVLEES